MQRVYRQLFSSLLMMVSATIFLSCNSGNDGNPAGGIPGNMTAAEYFGLIPGRTIEAGYVNYTSDSGRQFISNSTEDAWKFSPVIGDPVTYHGALAYPVFGAPIRRHYTDPAYTFTLYFSADSTGLYWHGGVYCGLDLPLAEPGRVAPYPLTDGANWQTIGHAETDVDQCHRSVADTLNATCERITSVDIRGNTYPEVYIIRIPFLNVPGHIGTRYYEVWLAPGFGPIRGASFILPDNSIEAYSLPKEGFEFIS